MNVSQMKTYLKVFRENAGAIAIVLTVLFGIYSISSRLDRIEVAIERNMAEIVLVKERMDSVDTRLESIESRLGAMENRLSSLENRMGIFDTNVSSLETSMKEYSSQNTIESTLGHIESRIVFLEANLGGSDTKVGGLETSIKMRFEQVNERISRFEELIFARFSELSNKNARKQRSIITMRSLYEKLLAFYERYGVGDSL